MKRTCVVCGVVTDGSRCPKHRRQLERKHDQAKRRRRPERSNAERIRRAVAVAEWRSTHGDWCPGWRHRLPHPSADLTAAHVVAVAAGGEEDGPLVVRCRSCNAAQGVEPG